jgi:hypothetical protein
MENMLKTHTKLTRLALLLLLLAVSPATIRAMGDKSRYPQAQTVPARIPTPFPTRNSHAHSYTHTHYHEYPDSSTFQNRDDQVLLSPAMLSEIEKRAEIETEEKSQETQEDSPEEIAARIEKNEEVYASNALECGVFPCVITITAGRSGSTTIAKSDPEYGSCTPYNQSVKRDILLFKGFTLNEIAHSIETARKTQKRKS